jgi:hypothetical protein
MTKKLTNSPAPIKTKQKPEKTDRQKAFVEAYFNNQMNATEAYQSLHPKVSRTVAAQLGWQTLRNIKIQAEIERRLSEQVMSANEVLRRLSDMAKANLLPFIRITEDGTTYFDFSHPDAKNYFHLIKKLKTKRTRRVVGRGKGAEDWEDEWVEVELHDAQTALEKIGKYHKLFAESVDLTSDGGPIVLNVVYQTKPEKPNDGSEKL